ncbi:MAG: hypothetical protein ABS81_09725 [Pseudonocardia sp. SCN 72-86]|nr:MAG: hypothetical protein ABS81_09725 [Pseudonocardia sp. SCN 72-86]
MPDPAQVRTGAVVSTLVFVELASGLVQGIVPTITPTLGRELGVPDASLGWISSVFLLSSALWVPVFSKLGDLHGHRRMLRVATILLAVGSILVALAPNFAVLLVGRVLQGALIAFLPLEMALVRSRLPREKARSAIAVLIGALTVGGSLGLVVGGALLQLMGSAQAVLWVPAIVSVLCVAVPFLFVPESVPSSTRTRMDWTGAALLALGLGALLLGLAFGPGRGWGSPATIGVLAVGVGVLAVWWWLEHRSSHPLVAVRLLARPRVLVLYLAGFLIGMVLLGPQTVLATYAATPASAGYGFGLQGLSLGFVLAALGAAAFVGSVVASRLARRVGQRAVVLAGFLVVAAAYAAFPLARADLGATVVAIAFVGLGCGSVISVLPAMILERLPRTEAGISAGLYNMIRTLGGSVIAAGFAAVLAASTDPAARVVSAGGYTAVWLVCAGVALLGAAALLVPTGDRRTTDTHPDTDALAGAPVDTPRSLDATA